MVDNNSPRSRNDASNSTTANLSAPVSGKVIGNKQPLWYACCNRQDHPTASSWTGTKRSSRRQAVKDASDHNRAFTHDAVVLGPTD